MSRRIQLPQVRMEPPSSGGAVLSAANTADEHVLRNLNQLVADRFTRLAGLRIVMVPVGVSTPEMPCAIPEPPYHPDCAEFPCADYCREKWATALRRARPMLQTQWHRCKFGMLCALVPVVWNDRCLAVCQMVSAQSKGDEHFEHAVEMLEVLIENYLARDAEYLTKRIAAGSGENSSRVHIPNASHPSVRRALDHIDHNLKDPSMTVASVARCLGMNPSYMAHLFSQQTGVRMSRHIADRRLELARRLLAETDWQVKRVAIESGHANADWFSHLFRLHTGKTPTQHRRENRDSG